MLVNPKDPLLIIFSYPHLFLICRMISMWKKYPHTKITPSYFLSLRLKVPQPSQTRKSLRKPESLAHLLFPQTEDERISCPSSEDFMRYIRQDNVNLAYQAFLQLMNKTFEIICTRQQKSSNPQDKFRGRVQFHDIRRHPVAVQNQASTLQSRKKIKAYNQAIEASKSSPGFRRDRTWKNIQKVITVLPQQFVLDVTQILQQPCSHDSAKQLATIFNQALEKFQAITIRNASKNGKLRCAAKIRNPSSGLKIDLRSKLSLLLPKKSNIQPIHIVALMPSAPFGRKFTTNTFPVNPP